MPGVKPSCRVALTVLLSATAHVAAVAMLLLPGARAAAMPRPVSDDARWAGDSLVVEVDSAEDQAAGGAVELPTAPIAPVPAAETPASVEPALPVEPATAGLAAAAPAPPRPKAPRRAPGDDRPRPPRVAKASGGATGPAPASSAATSASTAATFGSEGATGVRDLARAFTRAISPANQADATWSELPVGPAGSVDLVLTLDADGHLESPRPSASTPAPLAKLVTRTVALLRGGTYAARGGAATVTLHLSVDVRDVAVAPVEGGTIELAWGFDAGVGHASFIRSGGRRVDITVRAK
jgi:hypothetical protein